MLHPLAKPVGLAWVKATLQTQQQALLSDILQLRGGRIPRSTKVTKMLSQGQVLLASQSLELGLVDALGDVHTVVHEEFPGRAISLYEVWGGQESLPMRRLSGLWL